MKSTAARCRDCFDEKTIARGTRYFRDGAVTLLRTDTGKAITIPANKLSAEDQEFLQKNAAP